MKLYEFLGMVARLSASGDPVDPDGEPCPDGFEHDTGDSLDALDEVIHKARKIEQRNIVPKKNFFLDGWSFRRREIVDDYDQKIGVAFSVMRKGAPWTGRVYATVERCEGDAWTVSPCNGRVAGFASFSDACKFATTFARRWAEDC